MESEVAPAMLLALNERYLAAGAPGVTDVIRKLGVQVPPKSTVASEYAWKLSGGGCIVTLWAEEIQVHDSGHWFYVDSLDVDHRRNGDPRGPLQLQRATNRVAILDNARRRGHECIGLLQTNFRSIDELEQSEDAKVSRRVKDNEHWYLAIWDEARNLAVIVRGDRSWAPTPDEIDAALLAQRTRVPGEPAVPDPANQVRVTFPDQAHRDAVEQASVAFAIQKYEELGFRVKDVSTENRGYDLEVFDGRKAVEHVEVKGTSMPAQSFFLTRNEFARSLDLPTWRLAIVTSALTKPAMEVFLGQQMLDRFVLDPLVWRCAPKPPGA